MKKRKFKRISPKLLETAREKAWSMKSMEAHGAGNRKIKYIGSHISGSLDRSGSDGGNLVFDYYQDDLGEYWFENRVELASGDIVSVDMYLFGYETEKKKKRKRYSWQR